MSIIFVWFIWGSEFSSIWNGPQIFHLKPRCAGRLKIWGSFHEAHPNKMHFKHCFPTIGFCRTLTRLMIAVIHTTLISSYESTAWKIQASRGSEPMTSVITVNCFANWVIKLSQLGAGPRRKLVTFWVRNVHVPAYSSSIKSFSAVQINDSSYFHWQKWPFYLNNTYETFNLKGHPKPCCWAYRFNFCHKFTPFC